MNKTNCWEFKKCGREQGGIRTYKHGVSPASTEERLHIVHGGQNAGRACWVVAGCTCDVHTQRSFSRQNENCMKCDFYLQVRQEEGIYFKPSIVLLNKLNKNTQRTDSVIPDKKLKTHLIMSDIILSHPVKTLDNKLLLPAGTRLSADIMNNVISEGRKVSYQKHSLLQHGTIGKDMLSFMTLRPYNVIYSGRGVRDDILNFMEDVHVISPILQSLDYFKEHLSYIYRHILNVFALSVLISKVMMSNHWQRLIEVASVAMLDIGNICVPINTLKKLTPLTQEERSSIEHHSVAGFILLRYYAQDAGNIYAGIARDHHERRDGSGYPRGIKLNDNLAEVVAVCDVYDALLAPRPYRSSPYENRTAIEIITDMGDNNILDCEVIKELVNLNRNGETHYSDCKVSRQKRGKHPVFNNHGVVEDVNN